MRLKDYSRNVKFNDSIKSSETDIFIFLTSTGTNSILGISDKFCSSSLS